MKEVCQSIIFSVDNHPMKRFITNALKNLQSKQKINLNQNKMLY